MFSKMIGMKIYVMSKLRKKYGQNGTENIIINFFSAFDV